MLKKNRKNKKIEKGYVMLVSMLVISAIGLSTVVSLVLLGVGSSRTSASLEQSNKAKATANACAESALQQIWNWDSYVGSSNLVLESGTCSYVVDGAVTPKVIQVSGVAGSVVRRISITIDQLHPYLHIDSWKEIP